MRYDTDEACGKWNEILAEDFRKDTDFIRAGDDLFTAVVRRHTNGDCITSDGLHLETANIQLGHFLNLHFRLDFLDGPDGYRMAPGRFSVATDTTRDDCRLATICCGLREPDGAFWYHSDTRITNASLPDDYAWAVAHTRVYGPPTIASWIARRSDKRGEQ